MRILILAAAIVMAAAPAAFAYSPANVDVSLTDSGKIQVVVTHPVGNPKDHYIKKIEVFVNGEKVKEAEYTSQVGNQQIEAFDITVKKGDKVSAKAYCNKYGEKTGEMVVEEPEAQESAPAAKPSSY